VTLVGPEPAAHLGGLVARRLVEVSDDPSVLDRGGRWAVVLPYDGTPVLARFEEWGPGRPEDVAGPWQGPGSW
jgi:para-aminobenzoate synthetase component I